MPTSEQTRTTVARSGPTDSAPWRMLVVSEDPDAHHCIRLAAEGLHYGGRSLTLTPAFSLEEAGEAADAQSFALLLLDAGAKPADALGFIRALRARSDVFQPAVILHMVGEPDTDAWQALSELGVAACEDKRSLSPERFRLVALGALRQFAQQQSLAVAQQQLVRRDSGLRASVRLFARMAEAVDEQALDQELMRGIEALVGDVHVLIARRESVRWVAQGGFGRFATDNAPGVPDGLAERFERAASSSRAVRDSRGLTVHHIGRQGDSRVFHVEAERLTGVDAAALEVFCMNAAALYETVAAHEAIERTQQEIVLLTSEAIEARSHETGNHVRRVGEYSRILALGAGLDAREAETLQLAAPLHDLGKVAIPDDVLNKRGRLSEDEWAVMQSHAEIGERILARYDRPLLRAACILAGQHHERWDGTGYPRGLAGEQIHIYGRIVALADVFDALGSDRCYKAAWPLDRCLQAIRDGAGTHFDPNLVDVFFREFDAIDAVRQRLRD